MTKNTQLEKLNIDLLKLKNTCNTAKKDYNKKLKKSNNNTDFLSIYYDSIVQIGTLKKSIRQLEKQIKQIKNIS